jgi:hypothetical protein
MMNQFKLDWYLASQVVSEVIINQMVSDMEKVQDSHPHHRSPTQLMLDRTIETGARAVMTWALPTLFKHLSQNQIKGTIGIIGRTGGRIGIRAVPILGAAMMIKDAIDLAEYVYENYA